MLTYFLFNRNTVLKLSCPNLRCNPICLYQGHKHNLYFMHDFVYYFRFCSECKSKVLRAYNILIGEVDSAKEKGYCPALYEGLRCCPQERHIHMLCDTDFISHLITRAEPELIGT